MNARECPVSYCANLMDRAETMVCTACVRRCPRPLRRDVWLANNDPLALNGSPEKSDARLEVQDRVMAYLEADPRGQTRRRGRPHRNHA